jgi:hypothetical protein
MQRNWMAPSTEFRVCIIRVLPHDKANKACDSYVGRRIPYSHLQTCTSELRDHANAVRIVNAIQINDSPVSRAGQTVLPQCRRISLNHFTKSVTHGLEPVVADASPLVLA